MEAAIRWSAGPSPDIQSCLLVDVAGSSITLNHAKTTGRPGNLDLERVARYDKVPNFTAFDWHKADSSLLALGLSNGEASLLSVNPERRAILPLHLLRNRTQRKTNSISFNIDRLLAVAHDRVRNDACLTVFDINGGDEPIASLCHGEAVNSVRFFPSNPQECVASVSRAALKLFDLRVPSSPGATSENQPAAFTDHVNNIAIDPMDDNYFASAGSTGNPAVSIWDKRWFSKASSSGPEQQPESLAVLDLHPAVNDSLPTSIWSIRYCGQRRGRFGVLSNAGAVRVYDLAMHSSGLKSRMPITSNPNRGRPWSSPHYVRSSHDLQYPYYDKTYGRDASTRVIAFDWIGNGPIDEQSILGLHLTRDVSVLRVTRPPLAHLTSRDELAIVKEDVAILQPRQNRPVAADELLEAKQMLAYQMTSSLSINDELPGRKQSNTKRLDAQTLGSLQHSEAALQRTKSWLHGEALPQVTENSSINKTEQFGDALAFLNVHKRRCREGYRLDASRNRIIAKDDPTLERLWAIISRLESLAANGGMVSDVLDLSYMGIHGVWDGAASKARLLPGRKLSSTSFATSIQYLVKLHGLPGLDSLPESSQYRRLLALEICGWCFSREGVQGKCTNLIEKKQYHRAIAVALYQGHKDLSLNMLRNLTRSKLLGDPGLGALLAANELNKDQRDMCKWMEEDASDQYLKTIYKWLDEQDWQAVVDNPFLHLSDRLSVALRYLDDERLTRFIHEATAECTIQGDLSGILLTGLTDSAMPLLQGYLSRSSDLQTVVLAASLTNPLYVDDVRYQMWKETYLELLQSWRLFIERTRFTVEHARRSVKRDGTKLIATPPRQISLRCVHCNGSLATTGRDAGSGGKALMTFDNPGSTSRQNAGANVQAQKVAQASGTVCPRCARHLPRCAICMQWLGSPEQTTLAAKTTITGGRRRSLSVVETPLTTNDGGDSGRGAAGSKGGVQAAGLDMALSRFVTFCANCSHGLHAHHAKQWFAKHGMCPVPDCGCLCGVRR